MALMAILRGLLFHWSAMTWVRGMDTPLRLGRERLERVVSELRSSECSCRLTKSGTWFNPPPTLCIAVLRESQDPTFGLKIAEFRKRISCMYNAGMLTTGLRVTLLECSRSKSNKPLAYDRWHLKSSSPTQSNTSSG
jgi:hypothetical protein